MNVELFIARKIYFNKGQEGKSSSPPAVHIAVAGIALGLAVMIMAVAIVIGFKNEVSGKVIGFGSHIQITHFDNNTSYETEPIDYSDAFIDTLSRSSGIAHFQRFATKPGIIKTDSIVEGMVLKGIGNEYNLSFLQNNMVEGTIPSFADSVAYNEVLISKYLADRLLLKVGDSFLSYFIEDQVKARRFTIKGIYETGFSDYDKLFVMTDIRHVQRLNEWNNEQVSGVEIEVNDYSRLETIADDLYFKLETFVDDRGNLLYFVRTIKEISPQIFDWLDFLDTNVWIILVLMTLVSGFTMISGLLIIFLERINMIGILKAIGAKNLVIRKVFLYISFFLIGKGMLWGNLIGVVLIAVQYFTHAFKLDPATYYVSYVPVEVNLLYLLLLNIGTLTLTMLMLVGPSFIISKVEPAKSIRFE